MRRPQQEAAWEEEATWDDDINSWDDAESYSEDYADPYAATPRQRPARKKKSELPGKLLRVGLFAMLALIVLGTFGGLGYLAINRMPMIGNNVVDMSWMPKDLEGIAYFEPAKLAATPFADMIRNKFPQTVSDKLEGVATTDIDSILIGFWQEEGSQVELPPTLQIPTFSSTDGLRSTNYLWVTKLNKDLPGALEAEQKNGEYKGVTLHSSRGKYSCMPDSRTILIGSERSVKAALDGKGKQFNHSSFRFVKGSGNVVLAAFESSTSKPSLSNKPGFSAPSFPGGSPFGASQKVGELFKQHARAGYLVINVDTQVSFSAGIVCYDNAGAASVDQELHTALDGGRKQIESLKSIPPLAKLSDPLTTLLNSLNVASSGDTVSISGTVEPSLIDAFPSTAE